MATVTPGKVFGTNERVTLAKLNQLGSPTVAISQDDIDSVVEEVQQLLPTVNRNLLINGGFDVWQRGGYPNLPVGIPALPFTLGTSADPEYGADRWYLGEASGTNKREITRVAFDVGQSDVPDTPNYYLRWKELVAETGANRPVLYQFIEDVRTLAGKSAVLTWWMKGDYSGPMTCKLYQHSGWTVGPPAYADRDIAAGSGGTPVLVSGATWTKYTATFDIPTLAGFGIEGAANFLGLAFLLPDNVTFQIDFAQVQLEQGTIATDFEKLPVLDMVRKCERYFEYHAGIAADDITNNHPCYYFATRKFRAPDIDIYGSITGTGVAFLPLLDVGYQQSTANSAVTAFFVQADAEIYPF